MPHRRMLTQINRIGVSVSAVMCEGFGDPSDCTAAPESPGCSGGPFVLR
jgi:hypothetical protein